jgi:hypothetical protein
MENIVRILQEAVARKNDNVLSILQKDWERSDISQQLLQVVVTIVIISTLGVVVAPLLQYRTPKSAKQGGLQRKSAAGGFRVCIHGGAGVIDKSVFKARPYYESLREVLEKTYAFAKEEHEQKISAVDVAEYAVKLLEDDPLFNAGRGSVYTTNGQHEMEASIMDGSNLQVRGTG